MAELTFPTPRFHWTERKKLSAAIVFLLAVTIVAYVSVPGRSRFLPPCLLHSLTGLHCPGCGATRAVHALSHGRVLDAFRFNPLFVAFLPIFGALFVDWTILTMRNLPPRRVANRLPSVCIQAIFVLIIAYWIARNIRVYPFILLAPA